MVDRKKIEKIKRDIKSLALDDQKTLLLDLLKEGIVRFVSLAEAYTLWLEEEQHTKSRRIGSLASSLLQFWHEGKIDKRNVHREHILARAAHNILQSQIVKGAQSERDFQKVVDDYGGGEDEYGNFVQRKKLT